MQERIKQLQASLPRRAAGLITDPVSRRYCTGFPSSDGMLLLSQSEARFFTDSRYIDAAAQEITACPVEELKNTKKQLNDFCARNGANRLFLEHDRTTLESYERLQKWLPNRIIERGGKLSQAIATLRQIKSTEEINAIKQAQGIAEQALQHVLALGLEGMTERELALELDFFMLRNGAEALAFETIVVAGKNGAKPHGVPANRNLRQGDFVTMDFGCVVNGLHSDMTRTVALGKITKEQEKIYQIVLQAQQAALNMIGPGVACSDVDAAARNVVKAAGYGEHFRHGTGHGVGYEIHELPTLSKRCKKTLLPGMVVTIEPGIYVPGHCGVRIEDMVLITETGCENLTKAGKELCS